ncbi:MAG: sensor histidine kinase [Acidobacteriia bacterium]|nr:sensor histidine kinase [Terriglobia bacterium]
MRLRSFPSWPRLVTSARILIATGVLWKVHALPQPRSLGLYLIIGIFFAYALAEAIQNRLQTGPLRLLALFGDTVFFLILAGFVSDVPWLSVLFLLHLFAEAILFFGPVEAFVVSTACLAFCLLETTARASGLGRIVFVGGGIACAASVARQRAQKTIADLESQLLEVRKAKEKALENERQRIASDFHDGPLQSFMSLQMRLDILRRLLERDFASGMEDLRQLQSLAQSQIGDLRAFLRSMRPADVDGANLMASARRTAENFQKESGIPVTFIGANKPVGLPLEASGEVLQMLREALHNVQKHAGATRVAVAVEKTDRGLEISIDDNGHGFAFAGAYSLEELELLRLGPASLKRRARSLNADLQLESRPGRGAGLKFRIPL